MDDHALSGVPVQDQGCGFLQIRPIQDNDRVSLGNVYWLSYTDRQATVSPTLGLGGDGRLAETIPRSNSRASGALAFPWGNGRAAC